MVHTRSRTASSGPDRRQPRRRAAMPPMAGRPVTRAQARQASGATEIEMVDLSKDTSDEGIDGASDGSSEETVVTPIRVTPLERGPQQ